jgi:hypothetical protein
VPDKDAIAQSSSADAARLLHRILSQPVPEAPRPRVLRPSWQGRAWVVSAAVTAAAAAVAVVMLAATVPGAHQQPGASGSQTGASLGVAANAVELVDYATRSAAQTPPLVPGPHDWAYFEKFYGLSSSGGPDGTGDAQTWQQVATTSFAMSWHRGPLTHGVSGGTGARLNGWPGPNSATMYAYLAALPAAPAELRKIILTNNDGKPDAAFAAIEGLFGNFLLSDRLQAELYAVLVSLPDVGFTGDAVDAAGRHGVGLYLAHDGRLDAIIVNARTYAYMGGVSFAVQGHPSYAALLAHPDSATPLESTAILNSGIVSQPGQVP